VLDLSRRLARAVRHRGRIAQIAEIAWVLVARQRRVHHPARYRETDCMAGRVGLELGNVVANYPFEGRRDSWKAAEFTETISRLSCA